MQLGVVLRNMGAQSTRETLVAAARAADALSAVADLWVVDHIAIPPDDAEGSDGRYLDPLATPASLAGSRRATAGGRAGAPSLFRPRPPPPPLFIGGAPPHAFRRALAHGAGWMPIGLDPEALRPLAADLRARAAAKGLPAPEVAALT